MKKLGIIQSHIYSMIFFRTHIIRTPPQELRTKTTKMMRMADERIMLSLLKTLKSIETKLETLNKNLENIKTSSEKTEKDIF